MCGIAGIINFGNKVSPKQLAQLAGAMADRMIHRGPDDGGVWVDKTGHCAFSHRRLSIIDTSSGGHQPMHSADGRLSICFNGELYSFQEVRAELEAKGHVFRTQSDTEVLLQGLQAEGLNLLSRIDAMYAFALYDHKDRSLVIARDPFGEKPLYYWTGNGLFAFASELQALTVLPGFDATIDHEGIAGYLSFQYVPGTRSIYGSVRRLPPGCYLRVSPTGSIVVGRHFAFETEPTGLAPRSIDDLAEELEEILVRSVRRKLISDVPLGAFLSGGVDSTLVAAIATKRLNRNLMTFSIGFENTAESEHEDAREMARMLGTDHRDKIIAPDMLALGEQVGAMMDEPNGDSSCLPTYLLTQFAREHVTVALSGDGGDELFGGYGRYFSTLREAQEKAGDPAWQPGDVYFSNRILVYEDRDVERLLGPMPTGNAALLRHLRDTVNLADKPLLHRLREMDAAHYMPGAVLPKVDRMSMRNSLEVRAPLLGMEVARFAARLHPDECYASGQGKLILKRVAEQFVPRAWLDRPKRGFGLPMSLWGRDELLARTRKLCLSADGQLQNWLPVERIAAFMDHQTQSYSAYQIWLLFILESWLRTHPARSPPPAKALSPSRNPVPVPAN